MTKRQLTIESLTRLILCADQQIEVLRGFNDPLAKELALVKNQLSTRRQKLIIKERGIK